ncbi:TetR family transcriptional regulator [candidate division CSSED10-310 bacterium]|uniref:TetR family transcriptional regulator n=1 Tax=candidate division CSSED10-310 bacterium TaxID=2855610 RepID=A0ABV6YUF6_UNCC1
MNQSHSKEKILRAAITEFAAKGKAGARMDSIAAAAGVNKAMLYYYYTSKDALFKESLRQLFLLIMDKQRYFAHIEGTVGQKLRIMVSDIIDIIQEHPEMGRLLMHELLGNEHNLSAIARELSPGQNIPTLTGIAPMLMEALAKDELRGSDVVHLTINVISLCFFPMLFLPLIKAMWNMADLDESTFFERRKESIIDLLDHGLFKEA